MFCHQLSHTGGMGWYTPRRLVHLLPAFHSIESCLLISHFYSYLYNKCDSLNDCGCIHRSIARHSAGAGAIAFCPFIPFLPPFPKRPSYASTNDSGVIPLQKILILSPFIHNSNTRLTPNNEWNRVLLLYMQHVRTNLIYHGSAVTNRQNSAPPPSCKYGLLCRRLSWLTCCYDVVLLVVR